MDKGEGDQLARGGIKIMLSRKGLQTTTSTELINKYGIDRSTLPHPLLLLKLLLA
jgi:hypothetical protein